MRHIKGFDLTSYNSYRIKATCANAFFPESEEELRCIYEERPGIKKILLGRGNNIIFSKEHYEADFIIFPGNFDSVTIAGNEIIAQAGTSMLELSKKALEHSLSGLEIFYDVPSSMGGAVVMNAGVGSVGEGIEDVLVKVRYYDTKTDEFKEMGKKNISLESRNSYFQKNPHLIITKVWLQLRFEEKNTIQEKMERIKSERWEKQPREYPNAGSVFKRPSGHYVGRMIEDLGLKGYSIGGAKVSEKHGGFIVNYDNAIGADILQLIRLIKKQVQVKYGINLEVEQRVI